MHTDHKFFRSVTLVNPSVDNRLCSTSQKLVEYFSKTCWQENFNMMIRIENVLKTSLQNVLKMSWRDFCKTSWRRLENLLKTSWQHVLKTSWRSMTKTNILVLTKTSWRLLEESFENAWLRWIYSSWRRLHQCLSSDVWCNVFIAASFNFSEFHYILFHQVIPNLWEFIRIYIKQR